MATELSDIPEHAALIELLSAEGAPPYITLDLTESDGDNLDGVIRVGLSDGKLVEVEVR